MVGRLALSCEKDVYAGSRSSWLLAIFRGKSRVAILLLVVVVTPTGNRDAGKFAADTTQLPTVANPKA
jgi:hypothetical protein